MFEYLHIYQIELVLFSPLQLQEFFKLIKMYNHVGINLRISLKCSKKVVIWSPQTHSFIEIELRHHINFGKVTWVGLLYLINIPFFSIESYICIIKTHANRYRKLYSSRHTPIATFSCFSIFNHFTKFGHLLKGHSLYEIA